LSYLDENQAERMDSSKASSPHAARTAALGRAIRARRKALRLTQIDLSRLAGCGPDFVYDVEAGKTSLRLDKLLDLLGILGLELVVDQGKNGLRIAPELEPAGSR
jgi:HTH-type transcriptional regulator/antitoxin HipB